MAKLNVGTSGWNYEHWVGVLYPGELCARHWLREYSRTFSTAEVNYSFYRLPKPETYENWLKQVPDKFLFTLKCSRLITHTKRLLGVEQLWSSFVENASLLKGQLGPVLCQFPENFAKDVDRLAEFILLAKLPTKRTGKISLAVEFRNASWFAPDTYRLLERNNVALVVADSARYKRVDVPTADFVYFRYH